MLIFPVITPLCKAMVDSGLEIPYARDHNDVMRTMIHVEKTFTMDQAVDLAAYNKRCVREGNFLKTTAFTNIQVPMAPIEPKLSGKAARKAARKAKLG